MKRGKNSSVWKSVPWVLALLAGVALVAISVRSVMAFWAGDAIPDPLAWAAIFLGAALTVVMVVSWKKHRHRRHESESAAIVHSYPKLLYVWPLIALGPIFWLLGDAVSTEIQGWIFITALTLVITTLALDLNRNTSIFLLVSIAGCWFFCLWATQSKGVMISYLFGFSIF